MAPQIYGWQHIVYLLITAFVIIFSLLIGKKYIQSKKGETIFIKIIACILLCCNIFSRLSVSIYLENQNFAYLLPNTFCGFTSLAFAIAVLVGKPNSLSYHCLWYMAICGGFVTLIYPDFLGQDISFFYLPTISGLLHHSFLLFLSFALIVFKWFKPELKKCFMLPIGIIIYILIGYFELYCLHDETAMCINEPLLSGTSMNCYFILVVGTALTVVFNLIIIGIQKLINKKREIN